jgi:hypothetical protein
VRQQLPYYQKGNKCRDTEIHENRESRKTHAIFIYVRHVTLDYRLSHFEMSIVERMLID